MIKQGKGFEAIAAALSHLAIGVLDRFDALDIAMPLEFTRNAWGGRMFRMTIDVCGFLDAPVP